MTDPALRAARRRLAVDLLGIAVSASAFGFVYGLAASDAGFSPLEAQAMSVLVFAGAAQFAAVGYVASGLPWAGIIVLTLFLNARHLLYAASLAPWLRDRRRAEKAVMAHLLTDEAFALTAAHFARVGRADVTGYWLAAIGSTFIPWNLATLAGSLLGGTLDAGGAITPATLGLDVVFPAAMLGLAAGLVTGRRELVAAGAGGVLGVGLSLLVGPAVGIVAAGLLGPLVGMAVPDSAGHAEHPGDALPLGHIDVERAYDELDRVPRAPLPFGDADVAGGFEAARRPPAQTDRTADDPPAGGER